MLSSDYDVIVAGHLCLDIIPEIPDGEIGQVFRVGKLVNVGTVTISTGGPVSNTGIGLKILGMKVGFVAKVGDDDFGRLAIERLRQAGNVDGVCVSSNESTSYTVVLASPLFDRIFLHYPGVNDTFSLADINDGLLSRARHFHFGYPPLMRRMYEENGAELVEIFARMKACGLTTSLDMSLPDPSSASGCVSWPRILGNLLPYVDIFLPSVEEALYMIDRPKFLAMKEEVSGVELIDHLSPEDYTGIAQTILSMGTKMTALKSAHRGFYFMTGDAQRIANLEQSIDLENWADRELWCPAFHVKHIATATGSGDSSIAGFLCAFLRGYSLEKTLKFANCVGYQNLHAPDALSGIKDWETTVSMVESGNMDMNDLHVNTPGWRWDSTYNLMVGPNDKSNLKRLSDVELYNYR